MFLRSVFRHDDEVDNYVHFIMGCAASIVIVALWANLLANMMAAGFFSISFAMTFFVVAFSFYLVAKRIQPFFNKHRMVYAISTAVLAVLSIISLIDPSRSWYHLYVLVGGFFMVIVGLLLMTPYFSRWLIR